MKNFFIPILLQLFVGNLWAKEEFILHRTYTPPKGKIIEGLITNGSLNIAIVDRSFQIRLFDLESGKVGKVYSPINHKTAVLIEHPIKPRIYAGGREGKIIAWDYKSGKKVGELSGHSKAVTALAFSADGIYLASAGEDNKIIYWNTENGQQLVFPDDDARSLGISPDGTRLAVGSGKQVKLWDLENKKFLKSHNIHQRPVTKLKFSPDGKWLVSGSRAGNLVFWRWKDNKIGDAFPAHSEPVTGISFDETGTVLVSCSTDQTIKVWNPATFTIREPVKLVDGKIRGCALSADGKKLLGLYEKDKMRVWKFGDNGFLGTLKGHSRPVQSLDFTYNGKYLISSGIDNIVYMWNLDEKKIVREFVIDKTHPIQQIRFSPDAKQFATAGSDKTIRLWNTLTREGSTHPTKKYKVISPKLLQAMKGHLGKVNAIDFYPTSNRHLMISGGADKIVMVWNTKSGKSIKTIKAHRDQVNAVRFAPDGKTFASASSDKLIKIRNLRDYRLVAKLEGHTKSVKEIAYHPKGIYLASASEDQTIKIWDLKTKTLKWSLRGHDFVISGVQFSPAGKILISASRDKTLKLWSVENGTFIRTLTGEHDPITTLALNKSGALMVAGSLGNDVSLLKVPIQSVSAAKRKAAPKPDKNPEPKKEPEPGSEAASDTALKRSDPKPKPTSAAVVHDEDEDIEEFEQEGDGDEPALVAVQSAGINKPGGEDSAEEAAARLTEAQETLNSRLIQGAYCKNSKKIAEAAYRVFSNKGYDDKAAYYALMKTSVFNKDLQMIYLMAKFGENAKFNSKLYNFARKNAVERYFSQWLDFVFNRSIAGDGDLIDIEFINCDDTPSYLSMPKYLMYIDIPEETIAKVAKREIHVDFQHFARFKDEPSNFRDQVYGLIELASPTPGEEVDQSRINHGLMMSHIRKQLPLTYSCYRFNFSAIQQWRGGEKRILFQLKRNNIDWLSYRADTTKGKVMLLKEGWYYLKINKKIKKAFIVEKKPSATDAGILENCQTVLIR